MFMFKKTNYFTMRTKTNRKRSGNSLSDKKVCLFLNASLHLQNIIVSELSDVKERFLKMWINSKYNLNVF